jgi:hypothetical protein
MQGAEIVAEATANEKTSEFSYPGKITIHKIEISTSSTHVADKKVVFDIVGLSSTNNMSLEYYDVPLGTSNISNVKL